MAAFFLNFFHLIFYAQFVIILKYLKQKTLTTFYLHICINHLIITVFTSSTLISSSSPVLFVDLIAKADSVNDRQFEVDVALLQIVCSRPKIHAILIMACLFVLKHGIEECVH